MWMRRLLDARRAAVFAVGDLVANRFDSAHIRYMRRSISAQSQASVPPAPAWIVTKALQWSFGPAEHRAQLERLEIVLGLLAWPRGSRRRTSSSPASSASSIEASRSSACSTKLLERLEHRVERLELRDDPLGLLLVVPEGRAVHLLLRARRGGLALSPKSKRVSEMDDPVDHALGRSLQLGIHGEKLLVMEGTALARATNHWPGTRQIR